MRINIKQILKDPAQRKELMIATIIATQAREGIDTTYEQAEQAYENGMRDADHAKQVRKR